MAAELLTGDCLDILPTLPDKSVHCCVTSPPYWGLRDYGTATWEEGDSACDHLMVRGSQGVTGQRADRAHTQRIPYKELCGRCGARRVDAQIGLEKTPDCGKHGLLRLRKDLTPDQIKFVVQRLQDAGYFDV